MGVRIIDGDPGYDDTIADISLINCNDRIYRNPVRISVNNIEINIEIQVSVAIVTINQEAFVTGEKEHYQECGYEVGFTHNCRF